MSLHINSVVGKIPKIIFIIIVILCALALARVAIWETVYYGEKEGSQRVGATGQNDDANDGPIEEVIDEGEVSSEAISAHTVSADKPRYLSIPKLNISNARIQEVGLLANGSIGTLANIYDVAWYRDSGKPGAGGTAIINGHNGGPTKDGVFKRLDSLGIGDTIKIERGDGEIFEYEVYENKLLSLEDADANMIYMQKSPIQGVESLSLITCSGDWSQVAQTYTSRSMVRATLKK